MSIFCFFYASLCRLFTGFSNRQDAKNYKVQVADISSDEVTFEDLIKEDEKAVLNDVTAVHQEYLIVIYSRDVRVFFLSLL